MAFASASSASASSSNLSQCCHDLNVRYLQRLLCGDMESVRQQLHGARFLPGVVVVVVVRTTVGFQACVTVPCGGTPREVVVAVVIMVVPVGKMRKDEEDTEEEEEEELKQDGKQPCRCCRHRRCRRVHQAAFGTTRENACVRLPKLLIVLLLPS